MLAVLLLTLSLSSAYDCPLYTCGALQGNQCIKSNPASESFVVQPCTSGQVCAPTQVNNSTCQDPGAPELMYPGDFCSLDADCTSNYCNGFVCVGLAINATCRSIHDCNPGLHCDLFSLTCQPQALLGDGCFSDYECANNLLCSYDSVYQTTNCTEYFSVPNGGLVSRLDNEATGLNFACMSAFAASVGNGLYECTKAPVTKGVIPKYCDADSLCLDSTKKYSAPCMCSYTDQGDAFCSLFPGDPPVLTAIANMKAILGENMKCNTYSRFSFNCFVTLGYPQLMNYYNFAGNFSLITGNTYPITVRSNDCLMQVFTPEYYKLTYAKNNYEGQQCTLFTCDSKDVVPANQCWLLDRTIENYMFTDIVYAQNCSQGYSCNGQEAKNATCLQTPPSRFPGDPCANASDCFTNECVNEVCTGVQLNNTCQDLFDCEAGMFCNITTLLCQMQVLEGDFCQTNYDCLNILTCNLNACVRYYSLGLGVPVDNFESNGYSEVCASGYVSLLSYGDNMGACALAPTSRSGQAQKVCALDTECLSVGNISSKTCTCGFSPYGQSFCPYFEGDPPLQNAIESYNAALANTTLQNCNTYSRNTYACFLGMENMLPFFYFALNFSEYKVSHLIKDAVPCVSQTSEVTASYYTTLQLFQNYTPSGPAPPGPPGPAPGPTPPNNGVQLLLGLVFALVL